MTERAFVSILAVLILPIASLGVLAWLMGSGHGSRVDQQPYPEGAEGNAAIKLATFRGEIRGSDGLPWQAWPLDLSAYDDLLCQDTWLGETTTDARGQFFFRDVPTEASTSLLLGLPDRSDSDRRTICGWYLPEEKYGQVTIPPTRVLRVRVLATDLAADWNDDGVEVHAAWVPEVRTDEGVLVRTLRRSTDTGELEFIPASGSVVLWATPPLGSKQTWIGDPVCVAPEDSPATLHVREGETVAGVFRALGESAGDPEYAAILRTLPHPTLPGSPIRTHEVRKDGRFQFRDVPPGDYDLGVYEVLRRGNREEWSHRLVAYSVIHVPESRYIVMTEETAKGTMLLDIRNGTPDAEVEVCITSARRIQGRFSLKLDRGGEHTARLPLGIERGDSVHVSARCGGLGAAQDIGNSSLPISRILLVLAPLEVLQVRVPETCPRGGAVQVLTLDGTQVLEMTRYDRVFRAFVPHCTYRLRLWLPKVLNGKVVPGRWGGIQMQLSAELKAVASGTKDAVLAPGE